MGEERGGVLAVKLVLLAVIEVDEVEGLSPAVRVAGAPVEEDSLEEILRGQALAKDDPVA